MRATLFLFIFFLTAGLFLWTIMSGALLILGSVFLALGLVLAIGYADTAILFLLSAREVRSGDETNFFEASAQEAYKLAVAQPKLYFYNGSLERGFVLQHQGAVSLVLNRAMLEHADQSELSAICFGLLLQVKKGMAPKRTKVMFILGMISWLFHGCAKLISNLIPLKELNKVWGCVFTYFLYPWLDFIFKIALGKSYFKRLDAYLMEYPEEKERLRRVGLKLRRPFEVYSLPSKKLMEFSAAWRSPSFKNILSLELLPHEWDFFFNPQELTSAKEV